MTQWLIRTFIRDPEQVNDASVRTAYGNLAGLVGIACNVILFLSKYLIGTLFGSIAIAADGINNLGDASSNIISLLGFRLSARKPDPDHPYGHGRYEYMAGLVVCVMIQAIGLSLAKESIGKILHPAETEFNWLSIAVLLLSIAVKLWMSVFNRTLGEKIRSDTLIATASDSRNDVISTAVVLISTVLCRVTGFYILDGIMGLAVAVFILYSGMGLVQETLNPLIGKAPDPELVKHITEKALSYPGVLGIHDLMVHDYGPSNQFASLHLEFPAEGDVIATHDLIDNIEHDFLTEDHLMVTVHYDPIVTEDSAVAETRTALAARIRAFDESITIHDLRMVPGITHTNVVFDCVLPAGWKGDPEEVKTILKQAAQELDPKYICIVKMEQSYVS